MTFEHRWILLIVWLPALWVWREWQGSARRVSLCLKAAGFAAVLLALAEPRLVIYASKVAAGILVDTSASLTTEDLARASQLTGQIEAARGSDWARVIPFARAARNTDPDEHGRAWRLKYTPGVAGRATNLEAALRDGAASLPAGWAPRLVLISDGNENLGSVVRGAWQARDLGIPIDTFSLGGHPKPNLRLESTSLPEQVFSGEHFPIDISLTSPARATASVEITAEGKTLGGASQVQIEPGLNHFRVHASVNTAGAVDLAGKIAAGTLGDVRFEQAITLRKPSVLLITQDPVQAGTNLVQTLETNQFQIRRSTTGPPEDLSDHQLVILDNWNPESLSLRQKTSLEDFVKQGGGLLWIGGDRNVYVENKGPEDPLERTLPAKLAPPRSPEGTSVVLIVDKSSSMEGRKMDLARLAAIGVIENLRPIDTVGVLIFDNSFAWLVPPRKATDRDTIKRLIAGITPDGGTQIAPAVTEAYRKIQPTNAAFKHVVLLTDGISEEGDSLNIAKEADQNKVTISTVGLGQDVNRSYLEKLALLANGKSYFLNDPAGLQQILLKDVMEHTGSTAVEKAVGPEIAKQAEILEGVGMDAAPGLRGYVRFISKPTAETILTVEKDPLFVRWQYELGRAAVFSSDAKNRWAASWITWPGYDKFWTNVVRDLLPHATASEAAATYDSANDELVVNYRLGPHVAEPAAIPDIYVFGPDGFQRPVKASKLAAGSYRVRLTIGRRQGLFRVRPLAESQAFPEVGLYRQEDEMTDYGSNDFVLRQISAATGGRFNPSPRDVFDTGGRRIPSVMQLWPGLLALAVGLNLIELVLRKGKSLFVRSPG